MFQIGCCHRPHPNLDQIWSKSGSGCAVLSRAGPVIQKSEFGPKYPILDQILVQIRTKIWSKIGPDLVQIRVRPRNLVQIKCLPTAGQRAKPVAVHGRWHESRKQHHRHSRPMGCIYIYILPLYIYIYIYIGGCVYVCMCV